VSRTVIHPSRNSSLYAEQHPARLTQVAAQLPGLVHHVGTGGERLHLGHVDGDREGAGAYQPPVDHDLVVGRHRAEQLRRELRDVVRGLRALEPDQVGAEHPAQQLDPAGELHEQFRRRERHVQEEADEYVGTQFPQQLRDQLQVIVLYPDGRARLRRFGGGRGEAPVDRPVGIPPAAVEHGLLDRVVVQRPQRGVGESLVVAGELLRRQRDGADPQRADVGKSRRGAGAAGPADPRGGRLLQDGVQRAGQAARAAPPLARAVGGGVVVQRQPVGDDHERTLAHHDRLLVRYREAR
jgi:hypothetical protein